MDVKVIRKDGNYEVVSGVKSVSRSIPDMSYLFKLEDGSLYAVHFDDADRIEKMPS